MNAFAAAKQSGRAADDLQRELHQLFREPERGVRARTRRRSPATFLRVSVARYDRGVSPDLAWLLTVIRRSAGRCCATWRGAGRSPRKGARRPRGLGARLIALQASDGRWGGAAMESRLDVDHARADAAARARSRSGERGGAVRSVSCAPNVTWRGCAPPECADHSRSSRAGRAVHQRRSRAVGAYFGEDDAASSSARRGAAAGRRLELRRGERLDARVVQHDDLRARGAASRRAARRRRDPDVTAARLRGQEYLLERRLFRHRPAPIPA